MKELIINYLTQKTKIYLKNNLLSQVSTLIDQNKKYVIITDEIVYNLYKEKINFPNSHFIILKSGEQEKNIQTVLKIIQDMLELNISKSDYIINFGGGVVSDIGGFVASIYKRGIPYYNIPTTLLSQVDATIGGKTGIDFGNFKNQIGTIYHPSKVFIDPTLLTTLDQDNYLSGLGEVIKYAICFDEEFYNSLKEPLDLEEVVYKCIKIKAEITKQDEFDTNVRMVLNFGHTIGHALESYFNYQIPHGICVAYGMYYEIEDFHIRESLMKILNYFHFPPLPQFSKTELEKYLYQDKKIRDGYLKIPVLEKIGKVIIKNEKITDLVKRL